MALYLVDALCTSDRPDQLVLTFNEAVLQVDASLANDALHLANYELTDNLTLLAVRIFAVAPYGARAVLLTVDPLVLGLDRYSISAQDVEATNGDVIIGDVQHLASVGLSGGALGVATITTMAPDITAFFTTPLSVDLAGVATDTGGKVWSEANVFSVDAAHRLKLVAAGAGAPNVCYFDSGLLDHTIEMTIDTAPPGNTDFGFLCQYDIAGSNWFIVYWSGVDRWAIAKVTAAAWPPALVSLSGPDAYAAGDVMRVVCSPGAITLFVNGVQKVQYLGANFAALGTGVGWYIGPFNAGDPTGQGRFNHFKVFG